MCAYERGGIAYARFAADPFGMWSGERIVAKGFVVTNVAGNVKVALANAEFVQLRSGRIVYGVNLRPAGRRYEVSPSAIGVTVSDDAGTTWMPLKVICSAPVLADGVRRGCWEPFFLELPDGTVQMYFADESPYVDGRRKYQEIAVMDSLDGLVWANRRTASYAPRCRDGMPVAIIEGDQIMMAIESNPPKHHLFPQIVRTSVADPWKTPVGDPSPDRCRPLADAADFRMMKAGAPYLVATKQHLILSWQQGISMKENDQGFRTVHLAVAKRGAFGDRTFVGDFMPPTMDASLALWNSLCPLTGDTFLLVSEVAGRIVLNEGRVVDSVGEHVCWNRSYPDPTLWKGADGRFYAYATPGGRMALQPYLVSDDGITWKSFGRGPFSEETAASIRKDWKWIWAPDRVTISGTNLLYVSLVNPGVESAIGVFRLRGDEPGEAYDLQIITRSKETGIIDTIDPEVVTDPENGKVWLFFGSTGKMYRVELTSDGFLVKPGSKYVHVAGRPISEDKTRAKVFEGAYLMRHGKWWYLFVSGGWYNGSSYCLRVGRSQTLEGVFRDREGRPMTEGFATQVLGTEAGDFYGPGHNGDFLTCPDGVLRVYYHSHWKVLDHGKTKPRVMLARRVVWDEAGWPRFEKEEFKRTHTPNKTRLD